MSRRTEVYGTNSGRMRSQSTDARPGKRIFSQRVMANHSELNLFGGLYSPVAQQTIGNKAPGSPQAPEARHDHPVPTQREYRSRSAAAAAPGSNYRSRLLTAPSDSEYDREGPIRAPTQKHSQRSTRNSSPTYSRGRSPTSGARARGRAVLEAGLEGNLPPIMESEDEYGSARGRESGSRMMRMPRVQGIERDDNSEAYTDDGVKEFPPPSPKMSPRLNHRTTHRRVHSSTPAFQSRGHEEEGGSLNDTIDDLPPPPPINFDRAAEARLGRDRPQDELERDAYLYGDRLLQGTDRGRDRGSPHHRANSSSRVASDRARQHRQDYSHRYESPNAHGGSRRELLKTRRQYEVESQTSDFTLSSREWSSTPAGGRRRAHSSTAGSGRRQARPAFDNTPYVSPPRGRGRELGPFAGVGASTGGGGGARAPAGMGSSGLGSMGSGRGRRIRTTSTPIKAISTSRLPAHRPVNPITGDQWYDGRDRPTESVWDRAYDITPDINHPERSNPMTKQEIRQKVKPAAVFSAGSPFDWSLTAPLDR